METNSQELIRKLKRVKQQRKISYNELMAEMTVNGSPGLSMTTLRRVFAAGSESRASSFNYEETLIPIAKAMRSLAGCPEDSQHEKEIGNMQEKIQGLRDRTAELTARLDEKDAMIMRLVDRLDQKDEIIRQLLADLRQREK